MLRFLVFMCSALPLDSSPSPEGNEGPAPLLKPAALATEGVPEIPVELAREVKRYQDIRSAAFLDWHPREGILVRSRIGALDQLYHVAEPGAPPRQLTRETEPVAGGRYLPDGSLLFTRGLGGDENFQIHRLPGDGSEPRLLTDGRSRNLLFPPDPSGRLIPYSSTRRNGRDADLFLLDLASADGARVLLEVEDESWSLEDWSQDRSRAILSRYVSANESHAFVLDLAKRTRAPFPPELDGAAPPAGSRVRRDALRFGPGARSVYLASDARSEHRELLRLDLQTGRPLWLTGDLPWDVEELEISPDEKHAAFQVNAGGVSRLFVLDLAAVERAAAGLGGEGPPGARREVQLPPCMVEGLRFSPDSARLGFTLSRASVPGEACSVAIGRDLLSRWTFSSTAGFSEKDFVEPESIVYPSFDGRGIPAFLYLPPASSSPAPGKRPVVVLIHGGPEGQHRPSFSAKLQYHLRELGAAVIAPNVRGSTGYGKGYALLDNGVLREDSVRDIGALLDWIAKDGRLDASRVAVVGGSYGGFMVLASLVRFGPRIRAGIDTVGISNFITFLENTSPYRRQLRRAEYGDERDQEMRRFFEKISPGPRMGELRSALLVVHGANDPRVPLSETQSIVERARSSGRPVWTLYASNEGHGFIRRENTEYEAAVAALFLKKHL